MKREKPKQKLTDEEIMARIRMLIMLIFFTVSQSLINSLLACKGDVASPSENRHSYTNLKKIGQGYVRLFTLAFECLSRFALTLPQSVEPPVLFTRQRTRRARSLPSSK
jgi:hypothetical protein